MKKTILFSMLAASLFVFFAAETFGQMATPGQFSAWGEWTAMACHSDIKFRVKLDPINFTSSGGKNGEYMYWYEFRNASEAKTVSFVTAFGADSGEADEMIRSDRVKDYNRITLIPGQSTKTNWYNFKSSNGVFARVGYFRTEGSGSTAYEGCNSSANAVDSFCSLKPTANCGKVDKELEEKKVENTGKFDDGTGKKVEKTGKFEGGVPVNGSGTPAENCGKGVVDNSTLTSNIKEKIVKILRENIESVSLEELRGSMYTVLNVRIDSDGQNLKIRFTERWDSQDKFKAANEDDVGWWQQDLIQTITFDSLAASLKPRVLGITEKRYPYVLTTSLRWLDIAASKDSQNYKAFKLPGPHSPIYGLPFDMGPADANYNELVELLGQLKAQGKPAGGPNQLPCKKEEIAKTHVNQTKPGDQVATNTAKPNGPGGQLSSFASSSTAIKQNIVENLRANIIRPFRVERATRWGIPTVFTVSDISVELNDNGIAIRYTMRIEGGYYLGTRSSRPGWNGYEPGSAQWQLEETIPLDRLSSTLSIDLSNQNYSGYFENTTNRVLIAYGREQILGQTFAGASGTARGPGHVYGDTTLFFYDVGPNNQNYDKLVALLRQLSGLPASSPSQSTANNPAPQNNPRPVVASSGNPAQDGVDLYVAKQYEKAIESFKAAIAKNPNDAPSNYNLGLSYQNLKRYDEAIAAFKQAIVIKPDAADAYAQLGNALDRSKHPDEALAAFKKSLELDPNNSNTYYSLGVTQITKSIPDAILSLKQAVRLKPDLVAVHRLLGKLLSLQKMYVESIDSYREALRISPTEFDTNLGLGYAYQGNKQYTESIALFKSAVEINPRAVEALVALGRSYLETKQYDLAISVLRMAVDIDKRDDMPHFLLGEAYCNLKNLPMALKEYNKLVELDSVLRFSIKSQGYPLCKRSDRP